MKSLFGNYLPLAMNAIDKCSFPLSFLAYEGADIDSWRSTTRAKVMELLSFQADPCPMQARVDRSYVKDGLVVEHVSYDQPFGPRTEGILLYPSERTGKLPAVVALHDHGGFKYFGKEKLVELDDEPEIMKEFKQAAYEGSSWATKLAKRGYAVFVPDVFLWGSRKTDVESVPDEYVLPVLREEPDSRAYIEAYNQFAGEYESMVAKTLFLAGTTWPGIMAYEDRRAVDYLLTRPEVDGDRIGCGGLSGGGLRTIYLAGLDDRIKCAVCVGFMSTNREVVAHRIQRHTWMMHVPHLSSYLDMPDILSLSGPNAVMVQYDIDDPLWTIEGQEESDRKLKAIYEKMGAGDRYRGLFYPGPHKFDNQMQEDAFRWLDQWLFNDGNTVL
ncbi:dienelactone hydrolase family protein [Paenibacillus sp. BC26]|uniref:dienelactone hydrolase family protein n=1 Tax=Paenibacillus sp. BC26 TaxID=1881032 RepID=UPI0008E05224|nr:dienelactone hydrolase family protein [Paenibacillus sp. BC26]SFT18841.1 BAAT / Acyl-CoA thioester hydrolase C terminal [Paenibacillus sp. BC26]